jgi:hypothetical protein
VEGCAVLQLGCISCELWLVPLRPGFAKKRNI